VSGRLDYIETIRQWRKRFPAPSLRKTLLKLQLLPRWLTSPDFRYDAAGCARRRDYLDAPAATRRPQHLAQS
jgi:hypothetical protein